MKQRWRASAIAVAAVISSMSFVQAASAAEAPPTQRDGAGDDVVVVERFALSGELLDRTATSASGDATTIPPQFAHHGPAGASPAALEELRAADAAAGGTVSALGSGDGGSSTASGCQTVTVMNEKETTLGATAYWYNTWTHWCWTRSSYNTYDISTNFYLSDVDANYVWRGEVSLQAAHYAYVGGYSTSGYEHERTGHFENCVFHYGCIGNTYPDNRLYSHYDGTWHWSTYG